MRRRVLALILGTAMALAGANAAFAVVASTVSIGYNTGTEFFHGKVHASNAECEAGRAVKVFKRTASGPALQGKATSKADGSWKLEVMHAHGHYFAVAPAAKVMHTNCGKSRSRTIDVM